MGAKSVYCVSIVDNFYGGCTGYKEGKATLSSIRGSRLFRIYEKRIPSWIRSNVFTILTLGFEISSSYILPCGDLFRSILPLACTNILSKNHKSYFPGFLNSSLDEAASPPYAHR